MRFKIEAILFGAGVVFLAAQFFQPARENPPADPAASFEAVVKPPAHAAAVIERSCRDCHSNRTAWPWYSGVSPVSWMVARDVKEGRARLNFSQWNLYGPEMSKLRLRAVCEAAAKGNMPPKYYTPMHPQARLKEPDVAALCGL
ncbi:MAG: heme-binding domain-containing protein [Acidobacteria bacterium]|nr:heme-binding domain-containing protein [Acidobacteriota bacterium]